MEARLRLRRRRWASGNKYGAECGVEHRPGRQEECINSVHNEWVQLQLACAAVVQGCVTRVGTLVVRETGR